MVPGFMLGGTHQLIPCPRTSPHTHNICTLDHGYQIQHASFASYLSLLADFGPLNFERTTYRYMPESTGLLCEANAARGRDCATLLIELRRNSTWRSLRASRMSHSSSTDVNDDPRWLSPVTLRPTTEGLLSPSKRNVTSVLYDRKRFTDGGIRHYDLFFPDGTCPTEAIILKFLEMAENEPGAIAIHCKAGLGRTGILILCFLMKHYRFTTEEAIGYIRLARPGSVIGPQQNFMREVEQWMWHEGDLYRQKMGLPKDHLGHLGGTTELSLQGHIPAGNATVSSPKPSSGPPSHHGAHRLSSDYAAPGTASSDMSLMQYRQHSGATAAGSHPPHVAAGSGASAVASLSRGTSRSTGATGFATRLSTSPLKLQENNISPQHFSSPPDTPLAFSNMQTRKNGASPTPMVTRSMPSMPTRGQPTGRQGSASSLRATLHTDTVLNADRPKIGVPERSAQSAVGAPGGGWAISANGQKVVAQSTYSMRNGHSRQSPAGYKSGTPNSHGIARTLAPNGQPRKIPMTMLSQYHARMVGGSTGLGGMGMVVGTPVSTSLDSGTGRGGVKTPAQLRYGMRTK
eukprot:gene24968-10627_t